MVATARCGCTRRDPGGRHSRIRAGRAAGPGDALASAIGVAITVPVMLSFLHGVPRGRLLSGVASTGRWLMLGGIGAWFGFLLLSRLALLVDRIGFLLGDWLGLLR